jgi:hypothetical protein
MLRHEKWHGLVTERDLRSVAAWCKAQKIAFSTVNIVEDLRIEHAARLAEDGTGFGWYKYNNVPKETVTHPVQWMSMLVFTEGTRNLLTRRGGVWRQTLDARKLEREVYFDWRGAVTTARVKGGVTGKPTATLSVLCDFAIEFLSAANMSALQTVLIDFRDTFPAEAAQDADGIKGIPDRMRGTGYSNDGNPTFASGDAVDETQYSESPEVAAFDDMPAHEQAGWDHFVKGGIDALVLTDEEFTREYGRPHSTSQCDAIAGRMRSLMGQVDSVDMRVSESGSRLHTRGAMVGDSRSFRSSTGHRGIRKVVVVVDQSGSMQGDYTRHGAAFVAAMLRLHQQRLMDVSVILTGAHKSMVIPPSTRPELVGRLHCDHGSESVDKALEKHADLVRGAESVLIYTDGNLTDGDVDAGLWRTRGVDLVGCCVAQEYSVNHLTEKMVEHFSRAIVALSGTELATAIVQYVTKTGRR